MTETKIQVSDFPTTRYQGSKRKILPWIYDNLKDIRFTTVLDGCGGSASVSYLFKKMGKSVTYNDYLKFNHIIGRALIENQKEILTDEDIKNLFRNQRNAPNIISKLFKGIYYLEDENIWLDKIGHSILNMNHYTGKTLNLKKSIAYYALFQACLTKRPFNLFHRNNLHIRTANVKRNFGNKTTWEKDFGDIFKGFAKEANARIFNSGIKCKSVNESIFDIEQSKYDLVYLDLPYLNREGTNETSNYFKCYHFLEGLVNYQKWESMIDYDTRNLMLLNTQIENSFSKDKIFESIDILINRFRRSKIVFSYKMGGLPSIDYIVKVMKNYKRNVSTRSLPYKYALNRQNEKGKINKEVLIIGT